MNNKLEVEPICNESGRIVGYRLLSDISVSSTNQEKAELTTPTNKIPAFKEWLKKNGHYPLKHEEEVGVRVFCEFLENTGYTLIKVGTV